MDNKVKEKFLQGKKALGTFFELESPSAMECIGCSGMDYVIIDMEHGSVDKSACTDLIRVAELSDMVPFVRIADVSHSEVQKAVDAGAQGLIVPCLRTLDEVKQLVNFAKFAPVGQRGFAPVRSDRWGAYASEKMGIEKYMAYCNENVLVLPQCETKELLEQIEEVVQIDGVDGIFVGPFDLSISLGKPAQFDDPEVVAAVDRVLKACQKAGKFAFIFAGTSDVCKERFEQGFDSVAYGIDAMMYIKMYKQLVEDIKESGVL